MDTRHARGAQIWLPAALPAGLHTILHANSAPAETENCTGLWTRNGQSLIICLAVMRSLCSVSQSMQ